MKNAPIRGRDNTPKTHRSNTNEHYRGQHQDPNQYGGNPMTPNYQDANRYEGRYTTPRQPQHSRDRYPYDIQSSHQQGNFPPPNHHSGPRYPIPTQNRYQSLAYEDYNGYHQQREPFLGQRGNKGRGGTPQGNPYPMNKRGGRRNPTPHHMNKDTIPSRREGEDAGPGG